MTVRRSTVGKGPGKYWRKGIGLEEFFDLFPDDEAAERLFIRARWPHGDISCPRCGGDNVYEPGGEAPLRFRCRPCRRGNGLGLFFQSLLDVAERDLVKRKIRHWPEGDYPRR